METKTVTTPVSKKEIVLKAWITGAEFDEIQKPFMNTKMKLSQNGVIEGGEIEAGKVGNEVTKISIETVVLSIDGITKNLFDEARKMRNSDYQFLLTEVNKIVRDEDFLAQASKVKDGIA
jgi:hypothetical protein